MARWLLGSAVRCCTARWVCVAGVLGVPFGLVGQARVCGVALPGDCVLVPCPLVSLPRGECRVLWGRVSWSSPLPFCPSASLSSLVLGVAAVSPSASGAHAVASVWWPLLWPGSSPGGQGVLVGCGLFLTALFLYFFPKLFLGFSKFLSKIFPKTFPKCVAVAPSSRLGVPSFPCAGPGGRWARLGAVRAVSGPGCGGASWWACASGGRVVSTCWGDGAMVVLPVWCVPPLCASWRPSVCPLPLCRDSWSCLFLVSRCFLAPVLRCPRCPVPVGACLLPWASPCYLAAGLPFALSLPGVLVVGWGGGFAAPMAHARAWVVWSHRRRVSRV